MQFRSQKQKQRFALLIAGVVLILASLACNLPVGYNDPKEESDRALQATMQALIFATPQPQAEVPAFTPPPLPPGASPFPGLHTATPGAPAAVPAPPSGMVEGVYYVQAGDTLPALAKRFGVDPWHITSAADPAFPLPAEGYLPTGLGLNIPDTLGETLYPGALLPDSEVIYSPSAASFSVLDYTASTGGYLAGYGEEVGGVWLNGPEIVERISAETSINPRILLAFLEHRSGWVRGQPSPNSDLEHPIGFNVSGYTGLYMELSLTAKQVNLGYYGWRQGHINELVFGDGTSTKIYPGLNAGSVGVQYLFSKFYRQELFTRYLYEHENFISLFNAMFDDPWARAASVEPLFPADLSQPPMELPFSSGENWRYTSGPHTAWTTGSPPGALDFSPVTGEERCAVSSVWVTASAPGVVVRTGDGLVVVDLDGDGYEQTGWNIIYMHIAERERVPLGVYVNTNDPLGHPSCEGGQATGKHVHIARKYNGEWISADGPVPFLLSGWEAHAGERNFQGTLTRGDQTVTANPGGTLDTVINR